VIRARCPECGGDAEMDDGATRIECACGYSSGYDEYIESMRGRAQDISSDYVPDRPGL